MLIALVALFACSPGQEVAIYDGRPNGELLLATGTMEAGNPAGTLMAYVVQQYGSVVWQGAMLYSCYLLYYLISPLYLQTACSWRRAWLQPIVCTQPSATYWRSWVLVG
jgi:hypothetical protein